MRGFLAQPRHARREISRARRHGTAQQRAGQRELGAGRARERACRRARGRRGLLAFET